MYAQKAPKSAKSAKTRKKHQKYQKAQKTQKRNQAKVQNANKRRKIKNALKKHLRGKSPIRLFEFCVFCAREEKKKEKNIK